MSPQTPWRQRSLEHPWLQAVATLLALGLLVTVLWRVPPGTATDLLPAGVDPASTPLAGEQVWLLRHDLGVDPADYPELAAPVPRELGGGSATDGGVLADLRLHAAIGVVLLFAALCYVLGGALALLVLSGPAVCIALLLVFVRASGTPWSGTTLLLPVLLACFALPESLRVLTAFLREARLRGDQQRREHVHSAVLGLRTPLLFAGLVVAPPFLVFLLPPRIPAAEHLGLGLAATLLLHVAWTRIGLPGWLLLLPERCFTRALEVEARLGEAVAAGVERLLSRRGRIALAALVAIVLGAWLTGLAQPYLEAGGAWEAFPTESAISRGLADAHGKAILGGLVVLLLMAALVNRSFNWGLSCALPAGVGVLAAYAAMGLFGIHGGAVLSLVPAVSLAGGAGAVHLVRRFRRSAHLGSVEAALELTLREAGPAVVVGTGALCLALVPLLFLDLACGWQLCLVAWAGLGACALGTLVLVPLQLSFSKIKPKKKR